MVDNLQRQNSFDLAIDPIQLIAMPWKRIILVFVELRDVANSVIAALLVLEPLIGRGRFLLARAHIRCVRRPPLSGPGRR